MSQSVMDIRLFHDFYEPYYFTKVRCEKRPPGYGLRCHRIIALLCKLIGIKDMYAKIEGAINPQNITKAFIRGLLKQVKRGCICEIRFQKSVFVLI